MTQSDCFPKPRRERLRNACWGRFETLRIATAQETVGSPEMNASLLDRFPSSGLIGTAGMKEPAWACPQNGKQLLQNLSRVISVRLSIDYRKSIDQSMKLLSQLVKNGFVAIYAKQIGGS